MYVIKVEATWFQKVIQHILLIFYMLFICSKNGSMATAIYIQ